MSVSLSVRLGVFNRHEDESGKSGEGLCADILEFPDGTCVAHWRSHTPSTTIFPNVKQMEAVHGHGGKTEVVFYAIHEVPQSPGELTAFLERFREEEQRAEARKLVEEIS